MKIVIVGLLILSSVSASARCNLRLSHESSGMRRGTMKEVVEKILKIKGYTFNHLEDSEPLMVKVGVIESQPRWTTYGQIYATLEFNYKSDGYEMIISNIDYPIISRKELLRQTLRSVQNCR